MECCRDDLALCNGQVQTAKCPMQSDEDNDAAADSSEPKSTRRHRSADLVRRIKESADKFALDGSSRGDLKLVSRTLRELRYAFKVFAPYRWQRKVTVFGSARTPEDHPSYQQAVDFGRAMADLDWLVITGAASGIMQAGHEGAGRTHSMGLNILLPFEQEANPVIAGDHKLVHMKYFFTRKLMFVKECDAVVCLPGGFGTMDEAFEVLTLLQTGKHDMVPLVFLDRPGGTYWKSLEERIQAELLGGEMISPRDSSLYIVTDDCQTAVDEVVNFYRDYHSMRYVREKLVLRLLERPDDEQLAEINANFSEILNDGEFEVTEALSAEKDEPELNELPRLMFSFNRRSLARLRELIDHLNQAALDRDQQEG